MAAAATAKPRRSPRDIACPPLTGMIIYRAQPGGDRSVRGGARLCGLSLRFTAETPRRREFKISAASPRRSTQAYTDRVTVEDAIPGAELRAPRWQSTQRTYVWEFLRVSASRRFSLWPYG